VGIYDTGFNRLVSTGSTVASGTASIQSVAAAVTLQTSNYWLAIACDNVTEQIENHVIGLPNNKMMGMLSAASSFPLPNPIVPAANLASANVYVCGLASFTPG